MLPHYWYRGFSITQIPIIVFVALKRGFSRAARDRVFGIVPRIRKFLFRE